MLTIMRGLPACGKSTRVKEMLREDGNAVSVAKDDIDPMLFKGLPFSHKRRKKVIQAEKELAQVMLQSGSSVIVDDTNLLDSHVDRWTNLAKQSGSAVKIEDMRDVPIEDCLEREYSRGKVGKDVIYNLATQAGIYEEDNPYVVFDLDGTLADITHRREEATKSGHMDWKKFFDPELVKTDKYREDVFAMALNAAEDGNRIVILSGRSDATREVTEEWLAGGDPIEIDCMPEKILKALHRAGTLTSEQYVSANWWHRLIMRPSTDYRKDTDLKLWFLDNYLTGQPDYVVDDRPCVIRAWRSRGLKVMDVGDGVEF